MSPNDLVEEKAVAVKAEASVPSEDIGFARRLREIYSHTTLRQGEDRQLFRQLRGDDPGEAARAKQRLIQGVEQYVVREAKKLVGRGVPLEDLIQEGITGVLRAMESYDPAKGFAFLTYADDWIRQRMLRACEREGSIERYQMRIPCHQYMANGRVQKVYDKLHDELGREPTPHELFEHGKLQNVQQAETALDLLSRSFTSLDAQRPAEDSELTVGEAIADPQAIDPVEETMSEERNATVWQVFDRLSAEERQVFSMRHGLGPSGRKYTQEEVCQAMGIKKSRLVSLQKSAGAQLKASPELRDISDEMLAAIV
jgi:RNA polymerase primary sigma factor